jgi:hypothetical protein
MSGDQPEKQYLATIALPLEADSLFFPTFSELSHISLSARLPFAGEALPPNLLERHKAIRLGLASTWGKELQEGVLAVITKRLAEASAAFEDRLFLWFLAYGLKKDGRSVEELQEAVKAVLEQLRDLHGFTDLICRAIALRTEDAFDYRTSDGVDRYYGRFAAEIAKAGAPSFVSDVVKHFGWTQSFKLAIEETLHKNGFAFCEEFGNE